MALSIDNAMGAARDALQARREPDGRTMWEHTLVAFTSDNGGALNHQGSNIPLRGGKMGDMEGGIRTPAAIGGGWLPPLLRGTYSNTLMAHYDWWATLSVAAGIAPHGSHVAEIDPAVDFDASGRRTDLGTLKVWPLDSQSMWSLWLSNATYATQSKSIIVVDETSRRASFGSTDGGRGVISTDGWAGLVMIHAGGDGTLTKLVAGKTMDFCARKTWVAGCAPFDSLSDEERRAFGLRWSAASDGYDGWGYSCPWVPSGVWHKGPCLIDLSSNEQERYAAFLDGRREPHASRLRRMLQVAISQRNDFGPERAGFHSKQLGVFQLDPFYPEDDQCGELSVNSGFTFQPTPTPNDHIRPLPPAAPSTPPERVDLWMVS